MFSASGLNDAPSFAAFTGGIYSNFLPFFVGKGGRKGGRKEERERGSGPIV